MSLALTSEFSKNILFAKITEMSISVIGVIFFKSNSLSYNFRVKKLTNFYYSYYILYN